MLKIDGSYGEGGGQILRTSLALAVLTGEPVEIFNIRAKRKNPGLQAQHLAAAKAAEKISQAKVSGARIGSQSLRFEPKKTQAGKYEFDIGTAGSTTLVAQTILLPLVFICQPSEILLIGGTHNPFAPPFHYLKEVFLPMVEQMGVKVEAKLEKWGFYPKGGGRIRLFINPVKKITPKEFLNRGQLQNLSGISAVSNLPEEIAQRQKKSLCNHLKEALPFLSQFDLKNRIEIQQTKTLSSGTFIFLKAEFQNLSLPENKIFSGFSALGKIGKSAEKVGREAAEQFIKYFQSKKCLDPYLADQIILYLAFSRQPFSFSTSYISNHLLTHIWLLEQFLKIKIEVNQQNKIIFTQ